MFSVVILSLIVCFFGFKLIQWLISYVRLCLVVNKIPGPFMVPLFGNVLSFSPSGFIHELVAISRQFSNHSIFRLWIGPHYWLVFHKPEPLEKVFNDSTFSGKAFEYDFLIPWIGKGLIVSKGAKWQNRRRLIAPTFSLDILNDFLIVFNDQAKILVDILKENLTKSDLNHDNQFDVIPYVSNCTLDILCETVMGININAQGSKHSKYVDAVLKIGPVLFQRPVNPLYWPNFVWERTALGKEYNEHLKNLHGFTQKVIKERDSEYELEAGEKKKKIAFLDLLLKVKREQNLIDLEGIKEEVDTFMFAGHDTSANTLSWAIYLIGSHPNVQEKLQNEVDNLFGNSNRHLTNQDLNELKYLECVILESLRLFPPAPFLGRSISEDCEIDGYKIPKGGTAIIFTYMLHRDERYFPNPDEFVPERFASPSLKEKLPEYSFIPFSAGPRFCIGKKFALFSIKIILAHLIRNFHIESANKAGELKGAMDLLLRPERGVFIRLKERF